MPMTREQFETKLTELADGQKRLAASVKDLAETPIHDARSLLYGGRGQSAGIRTGEDPMGSRGWSLLRVMALKAGILEPDEAKTELDIHRKLSTAFVDAGFKKASAGSIMCPMSSDYMSATDPTLAGEVRQSVMAGVEGMDLEYVRWLRRQSSTPVSVKQTLSRYDDTAGGSLIPNAAFGGEIIELLKAASVLERAGAREVPLPPQGSLDMGSITSGPTVYWVGQSESITDSNIGTGKASMTAKKQAAMTKVPNELVRYSAGSAAIEAIIREETAKAMATDLDQQALTGASSSVRVRGLTSYSNVQTLSATTQDSNGDQLEPRDIARMLSALESANHEISETFAFVCRPANLWDILERRSDSVSASDGAGGYLFSANRDQIATGNPVRLRGVRVLTSTSVSRTREKGSASNLSMIFAGDWQRLLVGRVGAFEVATSTQGDTPFTQDESWLRTIQSVDTVPTHPDGFVYIDDLLSTFSD